MHTRLICAAASLLGVILLAAVAATAAPVQPVFSAANFTPGAPIDNTFFPLVPGTVFTYEANVTDPDSGDSGLEHETDTVTNTTKQIAGVSTRVVRVRTLLDQQLIEDTSDYYAQDKSGNIWYMGEDTKAFEYDDNGKLTSTDTTGTWHAAVNGAQPGFQMPANPQVIGFSYFQEQAPADQAVDQAETISLTETIDTPAGHFTDVLTTLETSSLEPGVQENKFYAAGVGNVMIFEDIQDNGQPLNQIPLISVTTGATAIPLPPAIWTGLSLVGVFALFARR